MVAVTAKRLLKRSGISIHLLSSARAFRHKWGSGLRTNFEIVDRLIAFSPNSAGTTKVLGALALKSAQQTFPLIWEMLGSVTRPPNKPSLIETLFPEEANSQATSELAALFCHYGSDKSSMHNYHLLYAPLLAPKRNERLRLLEIGVGTNNPDVVSTMGASGKPGASLRAFRDFLPNARVFGADIDRRILFEEERILTYHVDQTRSISFDGLADKLGNEGFDLVIDDGLHSPNANIATMIFALKILKPLGWFVVEDIRPSSIPIWQVISVLMPENYRPTLIEAENGLLFMIQETESTFLNTKSADITLVEDDECEATSRLLPQSTGQTSRYPLLLAS